MKEDQIKEIRAYLKECRNKEAKIILEEQLLENPQDADLHYYMGNLHRQENHLTEALNEYAKAIAIDATSPAVGAKEMLIQIIQFYDKERYNV